MSDTDVEWDMGRVLGFLAALESSLMLLKLIWPVMDISEKLRLQKCPSIFF